MSQKNDKDLTVSKVYDTLKSPSFLKDLYWDIQSGIKESNTYKLMRESAETLINQKTEALNDLSDSESDVPRKTVVAQICCMSYAIDTVFSKILFMKLEKAFKSQLPDMIEQLRNDGKIPDEIWSQIELQQEASETKHSIENTKITNHLDMKKTEAQNKSTILLGKRKRKVSEEDEEVDVVTYDDIVTNNVENKKANLPKKRLGGRIQISSKKNSFVHVTSTPKRNLAEESKVSIKPNTSKAIEDNAADIPKTLLQNEIYKDSDSESDISVGHISLASVSSVHTSDLSSFDDEISLSSEDEDGKKKKLSIKDLQDKLSESKNLSPRLAKKLNGAKLKKTCSKESSPNKKVVENTKQDMEAGTLDTPVSSAETAPSQSSNEKELPKRVRKPNSKYSSATMLCPSVKVKERKRSAVTKSANEKNSDNELSPKRSRIESSEVEVNTTNETPKTNNEENNTESDVKSPLKQTNFTNIYSKPHSIVRPLTSRRTAPLTLYST